MGKFNLHVMNFSNENLASKYESKTSSEGNKHHLQSNVTKSYQAMRS